VDRILYGYSKTVTPEYVYAIVTPGFVYEMGSPAGVRRCLFW
jgi:hypothetical protein